MDRDSCTVGPARTVVPATAITSCAIVTICNICSSICTISKILTVKGGTTTAGMLSGITHQLIGNQACLSCAVIIHENVSCDSNHRVILSHVIGRHV